MAKHRKSKSRRSGGFRFKKSRRSGGHHKLGGMKILGVNVMTEAALPGLYGAFRADLADRITPLVQKLPGADKFGNSIDEVGLIAASVILDKTGIARKLPYGSEVMSNIRRIEFAQIGQDLRRGTTGLNNQGGLF